MQQKLVMRKVNIERDELPPGPMNRRKCPSGIIVNIPKQQMQRAWDSPVS